MATKMKCDYCGKIYYKDGAMNELGELTGVGSIVGGVRGLSRIAGGGRNFCSTRCKNAYKQENGSTGGGGGDAEAAAAAAAAAAKQSTLQAVAMTTYDDGDPSHILSKMQGVVALSDQFKNGDDGKFVDVGRAVQKKLDEGLYKLKQSGVSDDDYYLQQALELKKDYDKLVLKKRRTNPMLGAGMMTFLVTWLAVSLPSENQILGAIVAIPATLLVLFLVTKIIK